MVKYYRSWQMLIDIDKIKSTWEENDRQTRHTSWRQEYLEMKAGLSKLQIRLLKEGPQQLVQAWLLQAMHNDYKKMKGITPRRSVAKIRLSLQSSLKEWFTSNKIKASNEFGNSSRDVEGG